MEARLRYRCGKVLEESVRVSIENILKVKVSNK
jgi:hypothetical protein